MSDDRSAHTTAGVIPLLGDTPHEVWNRMVEVWNFPFIELDQRPLTPGKIVSALLLFALGLALSHLLSARLGRRLVQRFQMTASGAAAIQTVTFYLLVVLFSLLALRVANVPLAVFTFLGGAVAIGVGFGSQNIVNNFISGLILLAERPIRVGDLIQFDSQTGTVLRIGARSTRLSTGTNHQIIVPNSTLLQTSVVNLTLESDRSRSQILVRVAYGSPTQQTADLLKQAALEHPSVLPAPEPWAWFTEFGDNALVFQLYFWVRMGDQGRVESAIRHQIDRMLREAGIQIPLPQRTVQLTVASPVEVQLPNRPS